MLPKNRVEARIMQDMAKEEPRFRDEIPELLGKILPETKPEFHGEFAKMSAEEQDKVINPKHYKILSPDVLQEFLHKGMEYMDIMRYALKRHKGVISHVLGQVFKYSFRLGGKDDELQDAKKIAWYANRLVEEIEYERGLSNIKPRGEYKE